MKKLRKLWPILVAAIVVCLLTAALVACNDGTQPKDPPHEHVGEEWVSDGTSHWHVCTDCGEVFDKTAHSAGDQWIEDSAATCEVKAHHHKECSVCGYHVEEADYGEFAKHTWKDELTAEYQKECAVCGTKEGVYEERNGKIYFGEYPQTKVVDNGIVATLSQMSGARPAKANAGSWTDYGYYNEGSLDEYMWYMDLEYQGERYRGVYFTSYRPEGTNDPCNADSSDQDDHNYFVDTLYWFKWEPIEWRVLEKSGGEAFIMSNVILDMLQFYHESTGTRTLNGETVYVNNYKESDIRAWLNDDFLSQAFDKYEQKLIKTSVVDNSAATSDNESSIKFDCANTEDKVFLLSYQDMLNSQYGFPTSKKSNSARQFKATDYAQAQGGSVPVGSGIYDGYGWVWMRSPCTSSSTAWADSGWCASSQGKISSEPVDALAGVAPAVRITCAE